MNQKKDIDYNTIIFNGTFIIGILFFIISEFFLKPLGYASLSNMLSSSYVMLTGLFITLLATIFAFLLLFICPKAANTLYESSKLLWAMIISWAITLFMSGIDVFHAFMNMFINDSTSESSFNASTYLIPIAFEAGTLYKCVIFLNFMLLSYYVLSFLSSYILTYEKALIKKASADTKQILSFDVFSRSLQIRHGKVPKKGRWRSLLLSTLFVIASCLYITFNYQQVAASLISFRMYIDFKSNESGLCPNIDQNAQVYLGSREIPASDYIKPLPRKPLAVARYKDTQGNYVYQAVSCKKS